MRTCLRSSARQVGLVLGSVVFLLCCCREQVSADVAVAPRRIVAYENETVTLPCRTDRHSNLLTVEWSKDGILPNITLLYRHGIETVEEKNPAFLNRTKLSARDARQEDISQVISQLRLSDGGRYQCRTWEGKQLQIEATLELIVGAVSQPKLVFVPPAGANGTLTLECRAERWCPEPNVAFYDEEGNEMNAEDPRRAPSAAGCFTVTRRVSLQAATDSVTCRVHQPLLNQIKNETIYIPDTCMTSCTSSIIISVLGTIVACSIPAVFIWMKCGRTSQGQKSPQPQEPANPIAAQWNRTEHDRNTELQEELRRLEAEISEKAKLISEQKSEIEDLKSKLSAAQQQRQPTTDPGASPNGAQQVTQPLDSSRTPPAATPAGHNSKLYSVSKAKDSNPVPLRRPPAPQKKDRPQSTPALFTNNFTASSSSSLASTSKESNISHSMSFSGNRPVALKPSRRNTISAMSNRFNVLADLAEESESLIMNQNS